MKILGLDTSTLMTTCAVMDEDSLIGEFSLSLDMSHSEALVPMIKSLLDNLNLKVEDMDGFAVSIGPGSFTGLRIGLATAKAFSHVTNKPILAVSSLEALALNVVGQGVVVPMMDARRDRVFTAIYDLSEKDIKTILKPDAIEVSELVKILEKNQEPIYLLGDGATKYKSIFIEKLGDKVKFMPGHLNLSRASSVCILGRERLKKEDVDNIYTLNPEYLRDSQAQRMKKHKDGSI
ncbi:MAG: tRNA (adenosine(37)-N6)-threonylcarbamoyltransferase complex dimerization subunit type 1 TsaB [Gudongella sp.]|nr:tRNA (adenosine(37)-N6)-threonylcarbamoyltransferase complex dimerization subunit type 1 TsaB [Gudongella sp.]